MNRKRIGILVYSRMQGLDLAGPMDAFSAATVDDGAGRASPCYELVTIGFDTRTVAAESGMAVKPQFSTRNAPRIDTLIIPGGAGMRDAKTAAKAAAWIKPRARQMRRIAAVCTGVYGL